jgi:hypothetical protein
MLASLQHLTVQESSISYSVFCLTIHWIHDRDWLTWRRQARRSPLARCRGQQARRRSAADEASSPPVPQLRRLPAVLEVKQVTQ